MQLSEGPAAEDDAAVNRSPDGQGEYNDEREVEVEDECDSEVRSELPAIEREDQRREDVSLNCPRLLLGLALGQKAQVPSFLQSEVQSAQVA